MLPPWGAGSGESVFVIDRSACADTVVWVVSSLFEVSGSGVWDCTLAVFGMTVPGATFEFTFTFSWNVSLSPDPIEVMWHCTWPDWWGGGWEQNHGFGNLRDWTVVPAGMVSLSVGKLAVSGPSFSTTIV